MFDQGCIIPTYIFGLTGLTDWLIRHRIDKTLLYREKHHEVFQCR